MLRERERIWTKPDDSAPLLDRLWYHVGRIYNLLTEPEPGLFTWCSMVGEEWKAIAELWTPKPKQDIYERCASYVEAFADKVWTQHCASAMWPDDNAFLSAADADLRTIAANIRKLREKVEGPHA